MTKSLNPPQPRIAILHSGDRGAKFEPLRRAFEAQGAMATLHQYSDAHAGKLERALRAVDAVLVWVNPIEEGRDRSVLDAMLRNLAASGVFVSAHPEVILKLGTKEVLFTTRHLPWGCDTHLYRSFDELKARLPDCLAAGEVRVLKQYRGNGGNGVWKVSAGPDRTVHAREAVRNAREETMPLDRLLERLAPYFDGGRPMIDQQWQPRLAEGMVRCYLVHNRVAGFGHQKLVALHPTDPPGPRLYYPSDKLEFQLLKTLLERDWVPAMQRILDIETTQLPVLWDCDFLLGPRDANGADTYVLCEVNVSSVSPFPDSAVEPMAQAVLAHAKTRTEDTTPGQSSPASRAAS